VIKYLLAVGFTEYEAKVYLELLRESPSTGYQLSKRSGVPRSMVYEALGRLSGRGAVLESYEDRATLYRPLPPDVLLDNLEKSQQEVIEALRSGMSAIYATPDEDLLWSITGRSAALSYAGHMIREAKRELMFVLSDAVLRDLRPEIQAAHERGLNLSTLLTGDAELPWGQVAYHPPLESELQQITSTSVIVADGGESLILNEKLETTATITRNRNLVFITGQFIWMELFTQRVYAQLGNDLLARLDAPDRAIFESLRQHKPSDQKTQK